MSPDRWEKINEIFNNALELPSAERESYVERECGDDAELLDEVRSLLGAESQAANSSTNRPSPVSLPARPMNFLRHLPELSLTFQDRAVDRLAGWAAHLATDTRLNRPTATKASRVLARDPAFVKRFPNEALAAEHQPPERCYHLFR